MSDGGEPTATVAYVGHQPPMESGGGIRIERVGRGSVDEYAPYADCVLLEEPGGGLEALARLQERSVPTVLYDRTADPTIAAEATRYGVTEYVTDRALGAETLADRIADAAGITALDADGEREERALQQLTTAAGDATLSSSEKVRRILKAGRERLGVSFGFLSEVDDGTCTVVAADGDPDGVTPGTSAPLESTFCRQTVRTRGVRALRDIESDVWTDGMAPNYRSFGCYIGVEVHVGDRSYGTLWFADTEAREPFTQSERTFVRLLAEWLGHEVERDHRTVELQQAQERTENVLKRVGDGFFAVDDDWELTYINPRAEALLDGDADEWLGKSLWSVLPEELVTELRGQYERALSTGEATTFEVRPESLGLWLEMSVYPDDDGLTVYFKDISGRKRYEQSVGELLSAGEKLHASESAGGITDIAAEAATQIPGFDRSIVRVPDGDGLAIDAAEGCSNPDCGTVAIGEGVAGQAYERGALVDGDSSCLPGDESLAAPLGKHGVIVVGCGSATGETDRRLLSLLASNVESALERTDRERQLRRYKAIHETVEQMVFVVSEGTQIDLVTQPLADRFGYDREELVGSELTALADDETVELGFEAYERLRNGEEGPVVIETTLPAADGETVPVEIEYSLLSSNSEFDGLVGVVRDRTELAQTRAELEDERDRFQHLFNQLPDAVVDTEFVEGEPVVRDANAAFEETFGVDAEQLRGDPLDEHIVPPGHEEGTKQLNDDALSVDRHTAEVRRETADGQRTFLFRGVAYEVESTTRGFGIYTDITERLEQERRLRVLHRVLRHNLRNEMTAIVGYADMLRDELDGVEHRGYAEQIYRQANEVSKLGEQVKRIQQALDVERRRVPVDPERLVDDIAEWYRDEYPTASISVAADSTVPVVADELLKTAVDNLVENAVEHHPGEPTVDVELEAVGDEWFDITVRDDGPGIPEREQAVISGEREITQLDHSMGLGLWVARWIVDGIGGEFVFGDCEDGTEVTLRLQQATVETDVRAEPTADEPPT
ncbi:sensor box histidine kinase [Natronomonas pharaonis DSM 2160]|uniref:histidine kinase n=1 Tax=Natronomonas pharaonis (strain ATCC 35678 / DSM 2160 / CIP 103997 / JCM 8858 / NBRC 14720 / NCIMB 2260 / Gabara) TaxID=348780 RepID=A0A1U7ETC4_NATPD|nr:PAS domain S-box protein [Natronomonas pharaonis]CAI48136.2 sensor box histidine kinase [Natronomonas pharaonis DSM 2160]